MSSNIINCSTQDKKLFEENKIGTIFHWGLYSVPAFDNIRSAKWRKIQNGSEWYLKRLKDKGMYSNTLGCTSTKEYHKKNYRDIDYFDFEKQFFVNNKINVFEDWCELSSQLGAKYMILTAKHHDGFCLWNTKTTNMKYNKEEDLLLKFKTTVKKNGFKFGIYFSLMEFEKPITKEFIKNILAPQLKELALYQPDYLWLDGNWEVKTKTAIKVIINILETDYKGVIINDRICKNDVINKKLSTYRVFGDRYIPEEVIKDKWQHINTIGLSWGYNKQQQKENYKTGQELYDLYTNVVNKGGEMLLNFGPKADGSLDENEVESAIKFGKLLHHKK